jgi:hypothetical protein
VVVVGVRLLGPSATNLTLWNAHVTELTVGKSGPKSRHVASDLTMGYGGGTPASIQVTWHSTPSDAAFTSTHPVRG